MRDFEIVDGTDSYAITRKLKPRRTTRGIEEIVIKEKD